MLHGSNDSRAPDSFYCDLRNVIEFAIENEVILALATKTGRYEDSYNRANLTSLMDLDKLRKISTEEID